MICGHLDESTLFQKRYPELAEVITEAHDTFFRLIQAAQERSSSQEQNVIIGIAVSCLKEFEEITLLCGNGYGSGANKLLRNFYERVVTLGYLCLYPEKVQQFVDYSDVHWHKLLAEAEAEHDDVNLSEEQVLKIKTNFENARDQFSEKSCKCGATRLQMSWTKKPIPGMAKDVDKHLRLLYFNAFLRPTFLTHCTFHGIVSIAEKTAADKIQFFGRENERRFAKATMNLAHLLLIRACISLNAYFQLGKDDLLEHMGKNLQRVAEAAE